MNCVVIVTVNCVVSVTLNCVATLTLNCVVIVTLNSYSDLDADGLPRWTEPDLSSCRSGGDSSITKQLRDILKTHITKGELVKGYSEC